MRAKWTRYVAMGIALLLAVVIAFIDALPVFGTGTVLLPWAAVFMSGADF